MSEQKQRRRKRKGPSLEDVARLAGVSSQTVSRVATGSDLVNVRTEARVREAMNRLGYVPNHAARALRHGSYRAIAVVTQMLERIGETLTTAGIVESAAKHGYSVTLVQADQSETEGLSKALARLVALPIDGVIIVRVGNATNDEISLPSHLPVSVSDSRLSGFYPSVIGDQIQGARDVMDHLIGLGHRHIHHLTGAADSHPTIVRRAVYQRSMLEAGLPVGKVWNGDWSIESGYQAGLEIAANPEVTAVFCANDEMAFGVMRALTEKGLRVPQDVSIAGFDDTDLSRFSSPRLTTVSQSFSAIAADLVEQLIDQIDGEGTASLDPVMIPLKLVVRESTGPVRQE